MGGQVGVEHSAEGKAVIPAAAEVRYVDVLKEIDRDEFTVDACSHCACSVGAFVPKWRTTKARLKSTKLFKTSDAQQAVRTC